MTSIGIVGAGAAAAAATYVLDETVPNVEITVLEKSGGVCGRAATRRRGEVTYDYGANYVKSDDERVVELLTERLPSDGLVDVTDPIYTFDAGGTVSEGRDADEHKWTYRAGLTQVAKRLFAETDATVHRRTRVEGVGRDDSADGETDESAQWRLTDADGETWGPFDVLLLNPPAPQTAELLATAGADWDTQARADLESAARDVEYRTIWTALLHYPFELDRPYYALVNTDREHEVGWVAREECKPGHVPDGESLLVVQMSPGWSTARYDDPLSAVGADVADRVATLLDDDRYREPDWTDDQGWRYALPDADDVSRFTDAAVDESVLAPVAEEGLHVAGDWVAGEGRVTAALWNGYDVGERIAERCST